MPWKIKVGDASMLLDDVPGRDIADIAMKYPATNWMRLYISPASDPDALYDVVARVAMLLHVPIPDKPITVKECAQFSAAVLEQVDDDLPNDFENGVPTGKAEETAMPSSSTSIAPEDGTPTSSDN